MSHSTTRDGTRRHVKAHATLIESDGTSHGLFASHKDRFIADVLAFLRG